MPELTCRTATVDDALPLMALYQTTTWSTQQDPVLLHYPDLCEAIRSPRQCWILVQRQGGTTNDGVTSSGLVGLLSVNIEPLQSLARIHRFYVTPAVADDETLLEMLFSTMNSCLRSLESPIEVIYSTTRTLTMDQLEFLRRAGFRLLGVFPNASGADSGGVNGIVGYFFDQVLTTQRYQTFELHPAVQPIYRLVASHCDLPPLPIAELSNYGIPSSTTEYEPLPPLEVIDAPLLVARRFARLKERRSLAGGFYPFLEPNGIVTDPDQTIEVFFKVLPENRFAAIIGECVELSVSPVELYAAVSSLMRSQGASYVETISDAADVFGIDCLVRAGFVTCAYVPCLKRQRARRRDFVVLGKPYERLTRPARIPREYGEFLDAYVDLDGRRFGCSRTTDRS